MQKAVASKEIKCSRCNGKGGHWMRIQNLGTRDFEEHYVTCMAAGCNDGIYDHDAYMRSVTGYEEPDYNGDD